MNGTVLVPLWVLICEWTLLFALGFLVILAFRQIGYILHLKEELSNIGSDKDGLPTGTPAPTFTYLPTQGTENHPRRFEPRSVASLLLFADPECFSCQSALTALEQLAPQLNKKARVLIATSSDPHVIAAVEEFSTTSFEVGLIAKEVVAKLYQTNTTPFLYLIDTKGVIQAKGIAGSKKDIKRVLQKADRDFDPTLVEVAYPLK